MSNALQNCRNLSKILKNVKCEEMKLELLTKNEIGISVIQNTDFNLLFLGPHLKGKACLTQNEWLRMIATKQTCGAIPQRSFYKKGEVLRLCGMS